MRLFKKEFRWEVRLNQLARNCLSLMLDILLTKMNYGITNRLTAFRFLSKREIHNIIQIKRGIDSRPCRIIRMSTLPFLGPSSIPSKVRSIHSICNCCFMFLFFSPSGLRHTPRPMPLLKDNISSLTLVKSFETRGTFLTYISALIQSYSKTSEWQREFASNRPPKL